MEFGVQCIYAKEIRCKKCRRLLMKGEAGFVEIKCPKCGCIQRIGKDMEKEVMELSDKKQR